MKVVRPSDPHEALGLLKRHGGEARVAAGATALQLDWAAGAGPPDLLIDLTRIAALREIAVESGEWRIGAAVTLAAVAGEPRIARDLPLLREAVLAIGAPPMRNLASLGGNVAGRKGCSLPALLALDAALDVLSEDGTETLALSDWLGRPHDPASLVLAVRVPVQSTADRFTHRKIGLRAAFTPSVIGAAGLLRLQDGRIVASRLAVGGGPVAPRRLLRAEAALRGTMYAEVDWRALHAALFAEIEAADDAFRSGRYRRLAAANALVLGLGGASALPPRPRQVASHRPLAPPAVPAVPAERVVARAADPAAWHVRPDIADKVRGRLAYLTDQRVPGMLVGRVLRAGIPHARIRAIDTGAAEALAGVVAVVTHRDVPGLNAFGIIVQNQPALCDTLVRYVGDPVAAVAAIDDATARAALALIRVEYEPLPVLDSHEKALAEDAPRLHADGNLHGRVGFSRGDVRAGFAACAHVVEETYTTPRQMHAFLETEGGWATPEPDGTLTVCVGGQYGVRDRLQLSRILAMPETRIRVVTSPTGGAFGGKDELTVQPALALLALKAGRPVRLHLDRAESVVAGLKRNPMSIRVRTGCDRDGRLLAMEVDLIADGGAYASLSPAVIETALEHSCGPYAVPNLEARARLVATNNGTCGAFRGFGANEMAFAVESQVGRLAQAVGLDPVAMRRINLRRPGSPGFFGQRVGPSERLSEMLDAAAASPLWAAPRESGTQAIGVGMALIYQGNGLGSLLHDRATVGLRLAADGAIEALFGLDEMGQGLQTAIRSAVAASLGIAREDIRAVTGDTGRTPDSGSTTASRGTFVVWRGAALTAPGFAQALVAAAAGLLDRSPADLALGPGGVREARSNSGRPLMAFADLAARLADEARPREEATFDYPKTAWAQANARYLHAFGATLARVAVDRVSGSVRVLDLHQHTAAGPILDAAAYLGQIEGGSLQGVGFTLSEHAPMEGGRYLTGNLDTYMLPGVADAPATTRVSALESLDEDDPHGPRGVGEAGIAAVAPAIAAAVADAVGHWPSAAPIPPETLLDALAGGRA